MELFFFEKCLHKKYFVTLQFQNEVRKSLKKTGRNRKAIRVEKSNFIYLKMKYFKNLVLQDFV